MKVFCVLLVLSVLIGVFGTPNHDELQRRASTQTAPQPYGGLPQDLTCEMVHSKKQISTRESIRIGYEFVDDTVSRADYDLRQYLDEQVLARVAAYLMHTLKAHRITGKLHAERICTARWKKLDDTCGEYLPAHCGVDNIRIPDHLLRGLKVCKTCYDDLSCRDCTTFSEGEGVEGYDFYALVTLKNTEHCKPHGTIAYSTWCVKDQCDRPVIASLNLCRSRVEGLEIRQQSRDLEDVVAAVLHEFMHAMVFSEDLWRFFRMDDGSPRFPRQELTDDMIDARANVWGAYSHVGEIPWSCGEMSNTGVVLPALFPEENGDLRYVDLSIGERKVVSSYDERGIECKCPIGRSKLDQGCAWHKGEAPFAPACIVKIVTPAVVKRAEKHFKCNGLSGAELENQLSSRCTMMGSHWEQRIFNGELMTARRSPEVPVFVSKVTLALFEDSGWYEANYAMSDALTKGLHWGYQQGCNFVLSPCINEQNKAADARFWCDYLGQKGCSLDRSQAMVCSLSRTNRADTRRRNIPAAFRYNDTYGYEIVSGADPNPELDYCPSYTIDKSLGSCTNVVGSQVFADGKNLKGEIFGSRSKCLDGNIRLYHSANISDPLEASCYQVVCSGTDSYHVYIADPKDPWKSSVLLGTCRVKGFTLDVKDVVEIWVESASGSVLCESPEEICSGSSTTRLHQQSFPSGWLPRSSGFMPPRKYIYAKGHFIFGMEGVEHGYFASLLEKDKSFMNSLSLMVYDAVMQAFPGCGLQRTSEVEIANIERWTDRRLTMNSTASAFRLLQNFNLSEKYERMKGEHLNRFVPRKYKVYFKIQVDDEVHGKTLVRELSKTDRTQIFKSRVHAGIASLDLWLAAGFDTDDTLKVKFNTWMLDAVFIDEWTVASTSTPSTTRRGLATTTVEPWDQSDVTYEPYNSVRDQEADEEDDSPPIALIVCLAVCIPCACGCAALVYKINSVLNEPDEIDNDIKGSAQQHGFVRSWTRKLTEKGRKKADTAKVAPDLTAPKDLDIHNVQAEINARDKHIQELQKASAEHHHEHHLSPHHANHNEHQPAAHPHGEGSASNHAVAGSSLRHLADSTHTHEYRPKPPAHQDHSPKPPADGHLDPGRSLRPSQSVTHDYHSYLANGGHHPEARSPNRSPRLSAQQSGSLAHGHHPTDSSQRSSVLHSPRPSAVDTLALAAGGKGPALNASLHDHASPRPSVQPSPRPSGQHLAKHHHDLPAGSNSAKDPQTGKSPRRQH